MKIESGFNSKKHEKNQLELSRKSKTQKFFVVAVGISVYWSILVCKLFAAIFDVCRVFTGLLKLRDLIPPKCLTLAMRWLKYFSIYVWRYFLCIFAVDFFTEIS